jgi:hypothetical protein
MKINTKATLYTTIVTVIYTLIVVLAVIYQFYSYQPAFYFHIFREILFMIPVMYLFAVLKHFHKKKSVIITFIIFVIFDIGLALLASLDQALISKPLVFGSLTLFLLVLLFVLMVQFLGLRNEFLRYPYFLFALSYFVCTILGVLGIVFLVVGYNSLYKVVLLTVFLIPLSLFYALANISKYIAQQDKLNQSIMEFGNTHTANEL